MVSLLSAVVPNGPLANQCLRTWLQVYLGGGEGCRKHCWIRHPGSAIPGTDETPRVPLEGCFVKRNTGFLVTQYRKHFISILQSLFHTDL